MASFTSPSLHNPSTPLGYGGCALLANGYCTDSGLSSSPGQALTRVIVLCSRARRLTLAMPLSTEVYNKLATAN